MLRYFENFVLFNFEGEIYIANYMVYDIGGSSVKWSIITDKGVILKSDKFEIPLTGDELFNELTELFNIYKYVIIYKSNIGGRCFSE